MPRVSYALDRTHQVGEGVPVNSDFNASHVPDQQSTNQVLSLEWEHATWRAAYRWGRSFQDNRQVGRQASDLKNLTHAVAVGVTPRPRLDLAAETSLERAHSLEFRERDTTRRLGVTDNWSGTPVAVNGLFSTTWTSNLARTATSRTTQIDVQATWQVRLAPRPRTKPAARAFFKYSHLLGRVENRLFGLSLDTREGWSFNGGLTVSLF